MVISLPSARPMRLTPSRRTTCRACAVPGKIVICAISLSVQGNQRRGGVDAIRNGAESRNPYLFDKVYEGLQSSSDGLKPALQPKADESKRKLDALG